MSVLQKEAPLSSRLSNSITSRAKKVWRAKLLLVSLATLIALAIVFASVRKSGGGKFTLDFSKATRDDSGISRMTNPKFQGYDSSNQPFSVFAKEAVQISNEKALIIEPDAEITLTDGAWLSVKSKTADLDAGSKILVMKENVNLFYDKGYELHTEIAEIHIDEGLATGDQPVQGQGPMGVLKADGGFRVENRGEKIIFNGPVRMTLYPGQGK